jgi:hypothetical protein
MASAGAKLLRAAEVGDAKAVEALLKGGAPVWAADEARARARGTRRSQVPACAALALRSSRSLASRPHASCYDT